MKSIDIIVPAYNEQECLETFYARLCIVLDRLPYRFRVFFVDDGSTDSTTEICSNLVERDARVGYVRLSRNFGHQAALTAGLDLVRADAAITLDADLQDPPEMLPAFIAAWEDGAEVVSGVRADAPELGLLKRWSSSLFYRVLQSLSTVPIPRNAADFRLLDAKVVRAVTSLREQSRFLRGIYAWTGFRRREIPYTKERRHAGKSKYSLLRMWLFALSAVLSFSRVPLRFATYLGVLVSGLSFAYGLYVASQQLIYHRAVPGWTSLAVLLTFLSGVQLLTLGIVGEYLGQVLDETKRRPLYLVAEAHIPEAPAEMAATDDSTGPHRAVRPTIQVLKASGR